MTTNNMIYSASFRTFTDMYIHTPIVFTHNELDHTSLSDSAAIPHRISQRNQGTTRKIL
jgi:hypothetical protein